jgi:hypothetical protein
VGNPSVIETTIRIAAMRQIHAAIEHWRRGDFECAMTLAGAAEGMLSTGHERELADAAASRKLRDHYKSVRALIEWLKRGTSEVDGAASQNVSIAQLDVVLAIDRAIASFVATFSDLSPQMRSFKQCLVRRLPGMLTPA